MKNLGPIGHGGVEEGKHRGAVRGGEGEMALSEPVPIASAPSQKVGLSVPNPTTSPNSASGCPPRGASTRV